MRSNIELTEAHISAFNPCLESRSYLLGKTPEQAWNDCERGDWMLWIAAKQNVDLRILTLAKARCARLVEHLMRDQRSIDALNIAERFGNCDATIEELNAAADAAGYAAADAAADAAAAAADHDAAYAAVAAAYAADSAYAAAYAAADARNEILKKCADICRDTIPFSELKIEGYHESA